MHGGTTSSTDCGSPESSLIFPYWRITNDPERPCIRNGKAVSVQGHANLDDRSGRTIACIIVPIAPFMRQIVISTASESSVRGQTATSSETIDRFAVFIAEASTRLAVPASWIRAVMQIESGGDRRAASPRGALGLMQLMPGTWVELSARYELGLDPFAPHDNVMAGTAYLKEMQDRFGSARFLAAYHAGPGRYKQHLAIGKPLPQDTIAYVAAVTSVLAEEQGEHTSVRNSRAVPWRDAPLFIDRADTRD